MAYKVATYRKPPEVRYNTKGRVGTVVRWALNKMRQEAEQHNQHKKENKS